jgi:CBS domain-containing protein
VRAARRASRHDRRRAAKLDLTAKVDDAVRLMRERSVRRIPVVADGKPVGIISLGDLARAKDPGSLLAQISAAPPNE